MADVAAGKVPENIEKGSRELPYVQEGGRTVVRVEIGEGQIEEGRDFPPSSTPSDDIGGVGARLAGRLIELVCEGQPEAGGAGWLT